MGKREKIQLTSITNQRRFSLDSIDTKKINVMENIKSLNSTTQKECVSSVV